ncbi:MAG: hypothetical protein CMD92_06355 [Gammaproteobacteria bacterium]|nr:hypothetical protein [Gammaproteobacteria bacterium]|tara:strand:+ start:3897 stop:5636 length:1740 start_codon:yes stop_codon:yes gene_type:complete
MASEAEIERLYQEFVNRGGGQFTFSNINTTPAQYYSATSSTSLTPGQQAALLAKQEQFNRQSALSTIASELTGNNFSNPYIARADNSTGIINNFTSIGLNPTLTNITALAGAFGSFSAIEQTAIFAGILEMTGVDMGSFIKVLGIGALGLALFSSLKNHTSGQMADLPKTLSDASALAGMNSQFGEQRDSCSFFNEILGVLSGAFDGTMDFIDSAFEKISGFLQQSGLGGIIDQITNAISGAGGIIGDVINAVGNIINGATSLLSNALGQIGSLIGKVTNAIADVVNQIAKEAEKLLNLATELASKALALAMAAAALDPCQMAVILNTGSSEMKGAVNKLTQPMDTLSTVPTTIDGRADAGTVIKTMDQAKREASQAPGVPQSPFTDTAKQHQPLDAYLHNLFNEVTGIFGDTFDTIKNAVGGAVVSTASNTGSLGSSSTSTPAKTTTTISSDAWRQWQGTFSNTLLGLKRDIKHLKMFIQQAINTKTFSTEELKKQAIILSEVLAENETAVSAELKSANNQLVYESEGNKFRIDTKEKEKIELLNSKVAPHTQRLINRVQRAYSDSVVQWNSIDQNVR